jgi:hypothetical protein
MGDAVAYAPKAKCFLIGGKLFAGTLQLEAMQLPRGRDQDEIGPAASDAHLL